MRAMTAALLTLAFCLAGGPSHSVEPLHASGVELGLQGSVAPGPIEVLGREGESLTTVLVLESPRVQGLDFRIEGTVHYQGVREPGYLEMWTHLPDGSRYFSRTLAEVGPLARLLGDAGPRRFLLPFHTELGTPAPTRLVVNVVLPGPGRVVLEDLRYVGDEQLGAFSPGSASAWWSERTAGLAGGALGAGTGLAGGLIGILVSFGAARALVLGLLRAILGLGVICLIMGGVAMASGQPYWVYYPLLFAGIIDLALALVLTPGVRRRYQAIELRRMQALDVR